MKDRTHDSNNPHPSQRMVDLSCTLGLCLLVASLLFLAACAAGRAPDGSIILGFAAGSLPETAAEFGNTISKFLPPPFNYIAAGASTLLLGGGGYAGGKVIAARAQSRIDAAWDEATIRATPRPHTPNPIPSNPDLPVV